MAKTAGHVRSSKWNDDPYHVGGMRKEFAELSDTRKAQIRNMEKLVVRDMKENLMDKKVQMEIDGGKKIDVQFDSKGIKHAARDAMETLSGKYFSRRSMVNIHKCLQQAKYVPSSHALTHERKDRRSLFFKYKDSTGRGVYFKVAYNSNNREKPYTLYSIVDIE